MNDKEFFEKLEETGKNCAALVIAQVVISKNPTIFPHLWKMGYDNLLLYVNILSIFDNALRTSEISALTGFYVNEFTSQYVHEKSIFELFSRIKNIEDVKKYGELLEIACKNAKAGNFEDLKKINDDFKPIQTNEILSSTL
ncbi:MAG: hypothetical protein N2749_05050 [Clostridia bacterium]|nr:hypothetical protein [Clostridia bacterium]